MESEEFSSFFSEAFFILIYQNPNIDFTRKNKIGNNRAGSIFSVLQSFIFRIESPELTINTPPTIDISVINSSGRRYSGSS